jgi:hypothetical protein
MNKSPPLIRVQKTSSADEVSQSRWCNAHLSAFAAGIGTLFALHKQVAGLHRAGPSATLDKAVFGFLFEDYSSTGFFPRQPQKQRKLLCVFADTRMRLACGF